MLMKSTCERTLKEYPKLANQRKEKTDHFLKQMDESVPPPPRWEIFLDVSLPEVTMRFVSSYFDGRPGTA